MLAGLAFGGLFAYLISENHYRYNAPRRHFYRSHTVYSPRYPYDYEWPRYRPYRTVVVERPMTVVRRRTVNYAEFSHCTMTREYTTRVEVDGEMKRAYGRKCLRPDGSWELGRPKLVPEFD